MNDRKPRHLTTNQFYGGLNRRFEQRASLLRRMGFKYIAVADGVAAFTRSLYFRNHCIAAATVMHADRRSWLDVLASNLRYRYRTHASNY